jgi:putative membrane protein
MTLGFESIAQGAWVRSTLDAFRRKYGRRMKTFLNSTWLAVVVTSAATLSNAQTPAPSTADPSAASSPHQRQATKSEATEPPEPPGSSGAEPSDAASPHQRDTMESPSQSNGATNTQGHESPASFVTKAAQDGMTEVELGKLALSKSYSNDVKQFAQRMVQDHGKANTELAGIAKAKGLDVAAQLDAEHQGTVKALSAKSGAAFDSTYAARMASDHAKAIALFQATAKFGDRELASFASKTLPTLQEHKRMADNLHSSIRQAAAGARME